MLDTIDYQDVSERTTYLSLRNDVTGASFGFFFIDDRLAYVLPIQNERLFFDCREFSTPIGSHWSEIDQTGTLKWLSTRSILEKDVRADQQVPELRRGYNEAKKDSGLGAVAEGTATLVAYSPFIVASLPILAIEVARGESETEQHRQEKEQFIQTNIKRLEMQASGFASVSLRTSRKQAIQAVGEPDKVKTMVNGDEYLWFASNFGILIRGGKVVLTERWVFRPFWERDERNSDFLSRWLKSKGIDPVKECPMTRPAVLRG